MNCRTAFLLFAAMLLLAVPARSAAYAAGGSSTRKLLQTPSISAGFGTSFGLPENALSVRSGGGPLSSRGQRETTVNARPSGTQNRDGPAYGRFSGGSGPSASSSINVSGRK